MRDRMYTPWNSATYAPKDMTVNASASASHHGSPCSMRCHVSSRPVICGRTKYRNPSARRTKTVPRMSVRRVSRSFGISSSARTSSSTSSRSSVVDGTEVTKRL